MVDSGEAPESWFLNLLSRSWLIEKLNTTVFSPFSEWLDGKLILSSKESAPSPEIEERKISFSGMSWFFVIIVAGGVLVGCFHAVRLLITIHWQTWLELLLALVATAVRVTIALSIALLWTIPVGMAIGSNRQWASRLQPVIQVVAFIPATALFPVILMALLTIPGGLNIAAIGLMLMGTQWYLLFNIIAGTAAIPQDLRDTTDLLRLSKIDRWRTLILPSLFPYIITGSIAASGGAWNASIVAEYVEFGGKTHSAIGIGASIAQATSSGNYAVLLASTLSLVFAVVFINRTVWARLYRLAEERYRME